MTDRTRVYYYFVSGACGGLSGWLVSVASVRAFGLAPKSLAALVLYGAVSGAAIGFAVTAFDGLANRSPRRFVKYGGVGLTLGALAGAVAMPLSEWLWSQGWALAAENRPAGDAAWKSILIGTLCWLVLGGLIGFGEGVGKGTQRWKGFLGGLIGGMVGGLPHEINRIAADAAREEFRREFFVALSLMLLGASIGVAIAYVTTKLKGAWMEVLDGKIVTHSYDVSKYVHHKLGKSDVGIIGSDEWEAHIYLPGDSGVLPRHASIHFANGTPMLTVTPEAGKSAETFINGHPLTTSRPLANGDELQFGSTRVVYREKSGVVRRSAFERKAVHIS